MNKTKRIYYTVSTLRRRLKAFNLPSRRAFLLKLEEAGIIRKPNRYLLQEWETTINPGKPVNYVRLYTEKEINEIIEKVKLYVMQNAILRGRFMKNVSEKQKTKRKKT